jgi:hypothetical protein
LQRGFEAWSNKALPVREDLEGVLSYAILASRLDADLLRFRRACL